MPTRKPKATEPPARKARTVKTAAKTPGKLARSSVATQADGSLRKLAARLGRIELDGLAGQLVKGWREDIAAIVEARQRSYAGVQAVVRRQTAQVKEAIGEWQTVGKVMAAIGPKQSVSHADQLIAASFQLALADIRELAELAMNSQRDAFDIVHRRINKNIDDVQRLLQPLPPTPEPLNH